MTDAEMIAFVKSASGEPADAVVSAFLAMSREAIVNRAFPFGRVDDRLMESVLERYQMIQCEIAVFLLNKRGAEGQISHNENGINRGYENGDIPDSMLKRVVPFCNVP